MLLFGSSHSLHNNQGTLNKTIKEHFISRLNTFQRNNLITGTHLAAEIRPSSSERRAFVVIGAYLQAQSGPVKPLKSLNIEQDNLRFWMRKYEINKDLMEIAKDITDDDLLNAIYLNNIQTLEELENELGRREFMTEKEHILKLMYRAFLDIRIASDSQDSHTCFVLSDIFHNIPLQINQADKGEKSYADIVTWIQEKCEERNCKSWLDNATTDIANWR